MSAFPPQLTVVMPLYNEAESLDRVIGEIREHVLARVEHAEVLAVDDGSTDATPRILDRLASEDPRILPLHQSNAGHGAALRSGMDAARGERLLLIDSDAEIALDDFGRHWEEAVRDDVAVIGIRRRRQDALSRRLLSRLVRWSLRRLFASRITDANVPYKLLRRSHWEKARPLIPEDVLAPSLFLAVFLQHAGIEVVERPVVHRRRAAGSSSLNFGKLFRFCSLAFRQLLQFRRRLRSWRPHPES